MIFKKLARFIWCLFFPPIIYKQKMEEKAHCNRHEQFKKGCSECRGLNGS